MISRPVDLGRFIDPPVKVDGTAGQIAGSPCQAPGEIPKQSAVSVVATPLTVSSCQGRLVLARKGVRGLDGQPKTLKRRPAKSSNWHIGTLLNRGQQIGQTSTSLGKSWSEE